MHGLPAAYIAPTDVARNKRNAAGFFEHAIIDGDGGHGCKMLFNGALERCLLKCPLLRCFGGAAFSDDGLYHFIYCGQMLMYLREYHRGAPHEHAGVPVITTLFQESFGSNLIRLFGETIDLINAGLRFED